MRIPMYTNLALDMIILSPQLIIFTSWFVVVLSLTSYQYYSGLISSPRAIQTLSVSMFWIMCTWRFLMLGLGLGLQRDILVI
jgi:hypothetical protein